MNRATLNYFKSALLFATPGVLFAVLGYAIAGWAGLAVCAATYSVLATVAFLGADQMVLRQHGAKYISEGQAPGLYALVSGLARRAMLPTPAVYLLPQAAPQLLVTGRKADGGAIALSTGLLELLSREELAAVAAQAISHLRYRETCPMAMAAGLAGRLISITSFFGWRNLPWPRFRREKRDDVPSDAFLWALIAPLAAAIIRATVYPSRHFRGDEASARLIGDAAPLYMALRKIEAHTPAVQPKPASLATAHLFLSSPEAGEGLMRMFRTHPPIAERLRRLKALDGGPVVSHAWRGVRHANK